MRAKFCWPKNFFWAVKGIFSRPCHSDWEVSNRNQKKNSLIVIIVSALIPRTFMISIPPYLYTTSYIKHNSNSSSSLLIFPKDFIAIHHRHPTCAFSHLVSVIHMMSEISDWAQDSSSCCPFPMPALFAGDPSGQVKCSFPPLKLAMGTLPICHPPFLWDLSAANLYLHTQIKGDRNPEIPSDTPCGPHKSHTSPSTQHLLVLLLLLTSASCINYVSVTE